MLPTSILFNLEFYTLKFQVSLIYIKRGARQNYQTLPALSSPPARPDEPHQKESFCLAFGRE
jgi:hypothetical protein